jgi:hypothetical protein
MQKYTSCVNAFVIVTQWFCKFLATIYNFFLFFWLHLLQIILCQNICRGYNDCQFYLHFLECGDEIVGLGFVRLQLVFFYLEIFVCSQSGASSMESCRRNGDHP